MTIHEQIQYKWELFKGCFSVLWADKELIIYVILGIIVLFSVIAGSLVLGARIVVSAIQDRGEYWLLLIALVFVFIVVIQVVFKFFSTALTGAALIRLDGGDPTLFDGFRIAWRHIPAMFELTLPSAPGITVLLIIGGAISILLGPLAELLYGFAGSRDTNNDNFFMEPILIAEEVSPSEAVKRSAALVRETWRGGKINNYSMISLAYQIALGLFLFGSVGMIFMITGSSHLDNAYGSIALLILFGVICVLMFLIAFTTEAIFVAAAYHCLVRGEENSCLTRELVQKAFRHK